MEAVENTIKYIISEHCKCRYAERIMGKDDNGDVKRFIVTNEEKIQNDIVKMIQHGTLIYTGRQSQKDGKSNVVDVYLCGCWVLLVDGKNYKVITLYKIDLGLGDDFNKVYIAKMMEKLNSNKEVLESVQQQVQAESDMYRQMIDEAEIQIKEYRTMIKNLEELCVAYRTVIENNNVEIAQANRDVADTLNQFIGRREF